MSKRSQITMTDPEVLEFLDSERTVTCATAGPRGWPHLMPLWYVVRDGEIWSWTYAKSQKVKNLERDARATLQVETGLAYEELRGVMLECEVTIYRDFDVVHAFGGELAARYFGAGTPHAIAAQAQAPKRVAMQFVERRRASWDHRKLPADTL